MLMISIFSPTKAHKPSIELTAGSCHTNQINEYFDLFQPRWWSGQD